MKSKINYIYLLALVFFLPMVAVAQGQKKIVQVSGLVVTGENAYGVPGVTIYIPKAGRGTVSNAYGYFSFPALPGDSAIISAVGYKNQYYTVPSGKDQSVSVIISLKADTVLLPTVEIFPFPTEAIFKEAFLSLKLDEGDLNYMRQNMNEFLLSRMRANQAMNGSMNHTQYMNDHAHSMQNKTMVPTVQLLNPFAWGRFIKSVRRGDLKKSNYDD